MKRSKSRKYAAFLALRAAGHRGLTLQQIVDASKDLHPEWTPQEQANLRTVRIYWQGFIHHWGFVITWSCGPAKAAACMDLPARCCHGFRGGDLTGSG